MNKFFLTQYLQMFSNFTHTGVKCAVFLLVLLLSTTSVYAEGVKQAAPASTDVVLLQINDPLYGTFASYNSVATSRLQFNIANPGSEQVHFGLSQLTDQSGVLISGTYYFRIKDPNGNIVYGPQAVTNLNANANTWALAAAGPSTVVGTGGYTPFTYTPTSGAPAGDYYIEFSDNATAVASGVLYIKYWDITVATRTTPTAINGRVWSKEWAFRTPSISNGSDPTYGSYDRPFNGSIHSYSDDGFVNKIDFNNSGFRGYSFNLAFNNTGPGNTGDVMADRKSVAGNMTSPKYKLFLSSPDISVYPSGIAGAIATSPFVLNCSGSSTPCIAYSTTQPGLVQVLLDFDQKSGAGIYDPGTADVLLYQTVTAASGEVAPYKRCVTWDGKNGLGATVPNSTPVPIYLSYLQGVVHFPMYDVEYNPMGYSVTSVRPTSPAGFAIKFRWDDTGISAASGSSEPSSNVFMGAALPSHTWTNYNFGNINTINQWWYGNQVDVNTATLPETASCTFTGPSAVCASSTGNTYIGPSGQDTYAWSITGSGTITSATNGQNVTVTSGASGTYVLTLTTTRSTCMLTCNQTVAVGLTTAITGPSSTCATSTGLIFSGTSGMNSYAWTITGNGTITSASNAQNVTVTAGAAGSFTLNLTVTGNGGACSANASQAVTVTGTCAVNKYLYLTDPSQTLTRTNPVATNSLTTVSTATLSPGSGAIAIDAISTANNANVTSITQAHTTGTGSNRLMMVGVSLKLDKAAPASVTYGGTALTLVGSAANGSNAGIYMYRLLNPPSGTANVIVDFGGSTVSTKGCVVGITTFTGVDQTAPLGTFVSNTGNSTTASTTATSAANELVFDVLDARQNTSVTPASGQTKLYDVLIGEVDGGSSTKAGAASTAMNWTFAASHEWAIGAINIKPATAVSTVTFTENPSMCSPLTIPSGGMVSVTVYPNIVTGTMPATPTVSATLKYGSTVFATLSSPTYNSGTGALTWTTTLGSAVTIPAGQAVGLDIATTQSGVSFKIDYNSAAKPSKITLPTSTFINVSNLSVYSAGYPGGVVIANAPQGGSSYVRVTVTDPFGATDISSVNLTVTDPSSSVTIATLTNPQIVATASCGSIYQYEITGHVILGTWNVQAVANEGSEGVTATATTSFNVVASVTPVLATKQLYLSDPSQILNRIDPVTTNHLTVGTTLTLGLASGATTVTLSPTGDNDLYEGDTNNYGAFATIDIAGGSSIRDHGIFKFDLSAIPTNATITAATLTLVKTTGSNTAANVSAHQITNPWTEGTFSGAAGVSNWAQRVTSINWTTAGGDYNATAETSTSVVGNGSYTWSIPNMAQSWVTTPANNNGVLMRMVNEATSLLKTYGSRENTTVANRPSLSVTYTVAGNTSTSFTQSPAMCGALTVKASQTVGVTVYVNVISGTMPTNPSITATLKYGTTDIVTLGVPTYNSATGTLTWTGTVAAGGVTIPAGQAVVLDITTAQSGVSFQIQYGGVSKPSKIDLPTETYINIDNFAFYNAAYPSGTVVTNSNSPSTVYARAVVSDPFGSSDITALNLSITTPGATTSTVAATSVATSGCMRTYEYALTSPSSGTYSFNAITNEGTENTVTAFATGSIAICPITVSASVTTQPTCFNTTGGVVDYTITGGTGPYTYNWSNGAITGAGAGTSITGLSAGINNITVTSASGCTGTTSIMLATPQAPTLSTTSTNISCNAGTNGTINLTATGGITPYIYYWQDGNKNQNRTGLFAGTWSVTVTGANGCQAVTSATLTEPISIKIVPTITNASCNGSATGAININVSNGVAPYTYDWENATITQNRTALTAGTYIVTVTDNNGCSFSDGFILTQPSALSATTAVTALTCSSAGAIDLTVLGGTLPYIYDWADVAGTNNSKDRTGLTAGTYSVTITDANNCTITASATIAAVVCAPVANPDYATATAGFPTMISILSNDVNPDVTSVTDLTKITLPTTPATGIGVPTKGTLTVNADGTIVYTPNAGASGNDTFIYTICNKTNNSACDTALVTVAITPAPVANPDNTTATAGILKNIPILANDKNPDGTIVVDLTKVTSPTVPTSGAGAPTKGTVIVNADGTINYTPNAGTSGNDTFIYTICDKMNNSVCDTALVTVAITVILNKPPIAINDIAVTPQDKSVSGNVLTNDSDPDNNPLTVITTPITPPSKGTAVLNTNGSYTYTPNLGQTGEDKFCYAITDGSLRDTACVTINIIPNPIFGNDKPIANDDATQTPLNTPVTINVKANDIDPDGNASLGIPSPLSGMTSKGGVMMNNNDGTFTYTPPTGFIGKDSVKYKICDNGSPSLCDSAWVMIRVMPTPAAGNQPPVAIDDAALTTPGSPVVIVVKANDSDPGGGTLGLPVTVTPPINGTVTINADGTVTYTPTSSTFTGSDVFTYQVCNNGSPSKCDTATVTIAILPPFGVKLLPRAYLLGCYNETSSLMHDSLRSKNLIPLVQPYNSTEYSDNSYNGTETVNASVFSVTGSNAIVDWVLVELHDASDPKLIVAQRAAIIQRDGDIVDVDGVSPVFFPSAIPANYYVAVKHRNHLGVLTATAQALAIVPITVDFTLTSTGNYKTTSLDKDFAQKPTTNGKRAMWLGNIKKDNMVIFQGPSNDINELYLNVVTATNNSSFLSNYILNGYLRGDVNMDGQTIYQGPGNETDKIFFEIVLHPINTTYLYNFIINEQIIK